MRASAKKALRLLDENRNNLVSLPAIVKYAGTYRVAAAIYELRNEGHNIENVVKYHGKQKHSAYRLIVPKKEAQ